MATEKQLAALTQKGKGRPKGAKNKFTQLQDGILAAYKTNGGAKWLAEWAKENPAKYFEIIARMMPKDINVNQSGEVTVTHQSASVSRVNEWLGQTVTGGVGQDIEDVTPEGSLLPH